MVDRPLMVRRVVGSIPHCRPIELFLVPASDPRMYGSKKGRGYILCCLWDGASKRTLAAHVAAANFLCGYPSGPLPYVRRHITVNKMC